MGQIYACQFSTGVIKVGRSENAASRCASHKRAAAQFGVGVLDVHVLDCDNSTRAEVALISLCKKTATKQAGEEWFTGLTFAAAKTLMAEAAKEISAPSEWRSHFRDPYKPRKVRPWHTGSGYQAVSQCRACQTTGPDKFFSRSARFGPQFVCDQCAADGYTTELTARPRALVLRRHGEVVPMWSREPDRDWPWYDPATGGAVRCEDLRPDIEWAVLRGTGEPAPQQEAA